MKYLHVAAEKDNQEILSFLLSQENVIIPRDCFKDCTKLSKLRIPGNAVSIEDSSFANCESLEEVFIPLTVNYFGDYCFIRCNFTSKKFKMERGRFAQNKIGYNAFKDCKSLKKIIIPPLIKSIDFEAFENE
ncbi:hypothetical protein M9Y10_018355 [Tritrichomonas musculus]|uniref:Surface antigen BspA-like protein n=1 Tax=Tritrichomonas musculus TaxID=1915356 RepID=A0ABR2HNS7_9EUKA